MRNRKLDVKVNSKFNLARQVTEHEVGKGEAGRSPLTQHDPMSQVVCRLGDESCAGAHASALQRAPASRPIGGVPSLLQLQRRYGNRYVQRVLAMARKEDRDAKVTPEIEQAIQQARGGGQALDSGVRAQMEPVFGADFSGVRVHTDTGADTLNRVLNARAFTTGQDIFFQQGAYSPGSPGGRELLAHELTHVVQQTGDQVRSKLTVGQPGDRYEQEADRVARAIVQQEPVQKDADEDMVSRLDGEEEEEESVQAKMKDAWVQRQIEAEEEEEEPIQTKAGHAGLQRQEGSRPSTVFQRTSEQVSSQVFSIIQRAGDPAAIPSGLRCPTDLTTGRPAGTGLLFRVGRSTITSAHTRQLTTFRTTWLRGGGTDDILVHGYASTDGRQGPNWTLSCDRAEAVQAELVRLGIPSVRISVVAHGESTDFGASRAPNRRAVVSTRGAGILPLVGGVLTPRDNFARRSTTRFGVGEVIDLSFASLPPTPAAGFGGLRWHLAAGGGALAGVTNVGTATYTAPATAGAVRLELRVATGATAGRVISSHAITIVIPSGVNITEVPGTAPNFSPAGPIPAGTWGAGFQGNVFVDPKDVSFQGVVFGEGTVAGVVTPAGSFLSVFAGRVHPVNTFGPGHAGNAATGTPVSPPVDNISGSRGPARRLFGVPICGVSDFLWAIPWEFSVAGGPRTPFATANHHMTSTLLCDATIEKGGAGPFTRSI